MSDESLPRERRAFVEWSKLHHAYGPASNIPALLQDARRAPAPGDYRDEPWFSLWSALCHQGDVFTASYAAMPDLVAIAEARRTEPRVMCECLYLAASIELGRSASEGPTPPPAMPAQLMIGYRTAIERAASLTEQALAREAVAPVREMLDICSAVFAGDLQKARRHVDGLDGAETE